MFKGPEWGCQAGEWMAFFHPFFIPSINIEHLLYARHWEYSSEHKRKKKSALSRSLRWEHAWEEEKKYK